MEVFRGSWSGFTNTVDSVIAVGVFDGLHRGHRAVVARAVEAARSQGLRSVVLTYEPFGPDVDRGSHPVPYCLTTEGEKLALLSEFEPDLVVVTSADSSFARLSAADFVQFVLKGRIGIRRVVIGHNHSFGRNQSGDRETLVAMSRQFGFTVEVVNPVRSGDSIISSSSIRDVLRDGQVSLAADALGRPYRVSGVIVHGFGRGRRLNFPTANLGNLPTRKLIPKDGIYAGLAHVRGTTHGAAISIGWAPTFSERRHTVEAHLLDFDDDIYDEMLDLDIIQRIRDEKKFESESDLISQISMDVQDTAGILDAHPALKKLV